MTGGGGGRNKVNFLIWQKSEEDIVTLNIFKIITRKSEYYKKCLAEIINTEMLH